MRCWLGRVHLTLEIVTTCPIRVLRTISFRVCDSQPTQQLGPHSVLYMFPFCAVILEKTIRIPRSLSVKAAQVLKGFLNKVRVQVHSEVGSRGLMSCLSPQNPTERLGCHPQTGFQDIVSHAFYKTIDWELVRADRSLPMCMTVYITFSAAETASNDSALQAKN